MNQPLSARKLSAARAWQAASAILLLAVAFVAWQVRRPAPIVLAFADSLTGPVGFAGQEVRAAVQIVLDEVNAAGGVDGHPVRLQPFDDRSDPAAAEANIPAILDSPAVAVLGHYLSAASLRAGSGYKAGHIAAMTATASADDVTQDNPYYFRAQTPTGMQAEFLAGYLGSVLSGRGQPFARAPEIDLVLTDNAFGQNFQAGFLRGGASKPKLFTLGRTSLADAAATVAEQLAQQPEPRIIVLGTAADANVATLQAIRRQGIRSRVILGAAAAANGFAASFAAEPEERATPGFFLDNAYAIAPMILDNTGERGEAFAAAYKARTGQRPSWIGAAAADAARIMVAALRAAHIGNTLATRRADREAVRTALASIDAPARSVPGINGRLFFNRGHDMPRPMQYGLFSRGRFISAPLQLVRVQDPDLVDIDRETEQGHIVQLGEQFYWLQRVVYTGIDVIHLNRVDVREGTFNADLYLWMRYAGTDDIPARIEFPDLAKRFDPAHPLQAGQEDGLNYRIYRLNGDFKANFDLHDYPFDTQSLLIRLVNPDHPRDEVAYVTDAFGLRLGTASLSHTDGSDAYRNLQLWHVTSVRPFVETVSVSSTLGKPALFSTRNRTEYGGFDTEIVLKRDVAAFVVKTLIPLFLLGLVVFAGLFFPPALMTVRVTLPVTAILTGTVLLISAASQLPVLGYTVALEYVFFAFFALCLVTMLTSVASEILRNRQALALSVRIEQLGRVLYPLTIFVTFAVLWWCYGVAPGGT